MSVSPNSWLLSPFEKLVNLALDQDPVSLARIRDIAGKSLRVHIETLWVEFSIEFGETGVQLLSDPGKNANATITASPGVLLKLLAKGPRDRALADQGLQICGDAHFVEQVFRIISDMDINWQDRISVLLGVPFTGQLDSGIDALSDWSRHFLRSAANNFQEYFHEEARLAPGMEEIELFAQRLDEIRLQIDRLEARTSRAEQLLEGG